MENNSSKRLLDYKILDSCPYIQCKDVMRDSRGQECFLWNQNDCQIKLDHPVAAALDDILTNFRCGELGPSIPTTLLELSYEYKFYSGNIISNHYRSVCDVLLNGGAVISDGFLLEPEIRDRCGFCNPVSMSGTHFYRGFTDNHHRPGLICQKVTDLSFPRGNEKTILPSKTKITLPKGSYLVDAEVFDNMMLGQSLHTIRF